MVTICNYLVPTRAELNAGTDLSAQVETVNGWSLQGAMVDVPDMGSRFTTQIPGRLTSPTNDITCLPVAEQHRRPWPAARVTRTATWCACGTVTSPGKKMDVFPARVITQAVDTTVDDPGKVTISFAITRLPAINLTIPA